MVNTGILVLILNSLYIMFPLWFVHIFSPHSFLFLQVNEYFVLLPVDICDVLDGGILDKVAPDDALERDGGAGVVELLRREAWLCG